MILNRSDGTTIDAGALELGAGATLTQMVRSLDSIREINSKHPGNIGYEQYSGAVLTFIDDDGTTAFRDNFVPIFKAHNVRATAAVVASRAVGKEGITTSGDPYTAFGFDDCISLIADGFDIQNHTYSHDKAVFNSNFNADVTASQIDAEYRKADKLFLVNGIDCNLMVYPWGNPFEAHVNIARRYANYGVLCKTGSDGLNDETTDPMRLNRLIAGTGGENLATLKAGIDAAIAGNKWLIMTYSMPSKSLASTPFRTRKPCFEEADC